MKKHAFRRRFRAAALRGVALGFAGLLVAAPLPADDAGPSELEALMRGMAGTSGVRAGFRERKELSLLSEALESRGVLYFVPPDRLARVTREPSESLLVIDGDRFRFRDGAGSEELDLSSNPLAGHFVANFIVLFNGDLEELRARYEPTFASDPEGWSLSLRPRRAPLRGAIDAVKLRGRGHALTRMELVESNGDRTVTWFEDVETDVRFSDEELERIFSPAPPPARR